MCANILRFNHTPVKTPINIHKEAPLMVVILIVRHCEEQSVAVLVAILMCDGFDQKSYSINLFHGDPAICGTSDQNNVAVLANLWPTGQFDQKGCDHLWPF